MSKKNLYIMVGAPGAGKSEWIKKNVDKTNATVVSRDDIRFSKLKQGDDYFAYEDEVFDEYIRTIQAALNGRTTPDNVYCDATQVTEKSRDELLDHLDLSNVNNITCIVVRPSIQVTLKRNEQRTGRRRVPTKVVHRMYLSFERPEYDRKYRKDVIYINE